MRVAKGAKARGQDVTQARRLMRECRDAMLRGNHAKGVWFAEAVRRIHGGFRPLHR